MGFLKFTKDTGVHVYIQEEFLVCVESSTEEAFGFVRTVNDSFSIKETEEEIEAILYEPTLSEAIEGTPATPITNIGDVMDFLGVDKERILRPEMQFNLKSITCKSCSYIVAVTGMLVDGLCRECRPEDLTDNLDSVTCRVCSHVVGKKEELICGYCLDCYHGDGPEGGVADAV